MTCNIKNIIFVGALALSLSAPVGAYADHHMEKTTEKTTLSEVRKEISQTFDSIANYTETKRDQAVKEIEKSLKNLDNDIETLENQTRENWHDMTEAAREKTSAAMKDIREKRNALGERYGELKSGSADAWTELKEGFSAAWSDFKSAWEDASYSAQSGDKK